MKCLNKVGIKLNSLALYTKVDNDTETTVRVRRVKRPDTPEHVQVEIHILKIGAKRNTQSFGYLELSPEAADILVTALTKTAPIRRNTSPAEEEAALAAFYGIAKPDRIY